MSALLLRFDGAHIYVSMTSPASWSKDMEAASTVRMVASAVKAD
jgi:hypothetical protein